MYKVHIMIFPCDLYESYFRSINPRGLSLQIANRGILVCGFTEYVEFSSTDYVEPKLYFQLKCILIISWDFMKFSKLCP